MKRKVLYISYDGMTDQLGQSQVLPYLAKLSDAGYEFTLLSFEKKDKFKKLSAAIGAICKEKNIRWVPEFFSSRPPLLSNLYDSWKMKRRAVQLHRQYQFSFTHCRSYVAAAAGWQLFRKHKVPFLFDMRGFWVNERVDGGQWNLHNPLFKMVYRIYKKKEKKYLKYSAHIISLTNKGKEELVSNYFVDNKKITVIPCCTDMDHFDYKKITQAQKNEMQTKLGLKAGDVVISYLGSLGGMYLADEMLLFFKKYREKEKQAKFLIITATKKEDIMKKAKSLMIDQDDIIIKNAARDEVPLLISLSHFSFFFIRNDYSKKASSPTKQGEIMAMGVPLICNDIGDTGKIIEESGAGLVVNEFSDFSFAKAVENSENFKGMSREMIRNAAIKYYDLKEGADRYSKVYKQI